MKNFQFQENELSYSSLKVTFKKPINLFEKVQMRSRHAIFFRQRDVEIIGGKQVKWFSS